MILFVSLIIGFPHRRIRPVIAMAGVEQGNLFSGFPPPGEYLHIDTPSPPRLSCESNVTVTFHAAVLAEMLRRSIRSIQGHKENDGSTYVPVTNTRLTAKYPRLIVTFQGRGTMILNGSDGHCTELLTSPSDESQAARFSFRRLVSGNITKEYYEDSTPETFRSAMECLAATFRDADILRYNETSGNYFYVYDNQSYDL